MESIKVMKNKTKKYIVSSIVILFTLLLYLSMGSYEGSKSIYIEEGLCIKGPRAITVVSESFESTEILLDWGKFQTRAYVNSNPNVIYETNFPSNENVTVLMQNNLIVQKGGKIPTYIYIQDESKRLQYIASILNFCGNP